MARIDTLGNFLTDVADAIRAKGGTSETIQASSFDTAISDLPSGGGADLSEYFVHQQSSSGDSSNSVVNRLVKAIPSDTVIAGTDLGYAFKNCSSLITIPLLDTAYVTNMIEMFRGCISLISIPQLDTGRVQNMSHMFQNCFALETVPILDTKNVISNYGMFRYCRSLSNESLNNILRMCVNMTNVSSASKSLKYMFEKIDMSQYYPASTIESLSNYQDFIDAGWTIGW